MVSSIAEDTVAVAEDGRIDVLIGPDVAPGEGPRTTPKTNFIFLRQYSHDSTQSEEAALQIARFSEPGTTALRKFDPPRP